MLKRVVQSLKCTLISIIIIFVLVYILAVISYTTGISNSTLTVCVYLSAIFSVLIGTLISARICDTKPLISSLITGLVFYAVILGITFILKHNITFNTHFFAMSAGIFATSVLGAIIGK